jgi:hypothetical protein
VPLAIRIHEGVVWSNRDRRTLLDKMLALLGIASSRNSSSNGQDTDKMEAFRLAS